MTGIGSEKIPEASDFDNLFGGSAVKIAFAVQYRANRRVNGISSSIASAARVVAIR
jgi:hypothetical protein